MSQDAIPTDQLAVGGSRLRVRIDGPQSGPPLVLAHMLGTDLTLWDPLLPALARFRVIRFDMRGHGGSDVGETRFGIDRLGRDVLDILDELEIERAHFCGLSMGGAVGLWLLAHAPERIDRAVIAGASAKLGTPEGWNARIAAAHADGMEPAVASTIERFFSPDFVERSPAAVEAVGAMIRATPMEGYVACCAALRDMDLREAVRGVTSPVLVLHGAYDPSVSAQDVGDLVAAMEGGRSIELNARHCVCIEDAPGFAAAVAKFLTAKAAPRRRVAAGSTRAVKGARPKPLAARAKAAPRRLGSRDLVSARRPIATKTAAKAAPAKASASKVSTFRATRSKFAAIAPANAIARKAQPDIASKRTVATGFASAAVSKSRSSKAAPNKAAPSSKAGSGPKTVAPGKAAPKKAAPAKTAAKTSPSKSRAQKRAKTPPAKVATTARAKTTAPRNTDRAAPAASAAKRTGASLKAAATRAATKGKRPATKVKAAPAKVAPRRASVAARSAAKPTTRKPAARQPGSRKP